MTLIQSMRSTEKGKRKKGRKKRGKNIQPGHLISLRFFSKTFVIKNFGEMFQKTDKFNPIYTRKIKFQNIPILWLTKFVGSKTLAPHTEAIMQSRLACTMLFTMPPLVSYRYHQGCGFCNNSKNQP